MSMDWYQKAIQAANRIDPAHTSPWKLASTYALLSIAESLGRVGRLTRPPSRPVNSAARTSNVPCTESRGRQSLMVTTTYLRWPRWPK